MKDSPVHMFIPTSLTGLFMPPRVAAETFPRSNASKGPAPRSTTRLFNCSVTSLPRKQQVAEMIFQVYIRGVCDNQTAWSYGRISSRPSNAAQCDKQVTGP
ncbi:hypothetical protein F4780DRAFT_233409 [Xylariomycetidae sp. FL0641]|nr:hypothetical protein F4780DRAFT_233409 [Xylariomycetidae sp. FL0641]